MKLIKIGDHTVDMDALPEAPVVLDAGSRYYNFSGNLLPYRPKARIIALEPDPSPALVREPPPGVTLIREALVGDDRKQCKYAALRSSEEGRFLFEGPHPAAIHYQYGFDIMTPIQTVPCVNLPTLMERLGIAYWDLVKMDIEEAEFLVVENWPGPIAGQISVEFHDWYHNEYLDPAYWERLLAGPLKDYRFVQHELTTIGGGPELGHWDSVLKLKSL